MLLSCEKVDVIDSPISTLSELQTQLLAIQNQIMIEHNNIILLRDQMAPVK